MLQRERALSGWMKALLNPTLRPIPSWEAGDGHHQAAPLVREGDGVNESYQVRAQTNQSS